MAMSSIKRARPHVRLALAGLALGALTLGGCASMPSPGLKQAKSETPKTALDQYKPKVALAPDELGIMPHPGGLSDKQQAALQGLAARWHDAGGDTAVSIRTPSNGSGDDTDALRTTASVVEFLQASGVPYDRIRQSRYDAAEPRAPVIARFTTYKVETTDCSKTWDNLVATNGNGPSKHFGCAMANNMAVQVADPHDLVTPVAMDAGDNSRRTTVLTNYRAGKVTATERDSQASGTVSQAIKP